jgi:hypothetical protein
MSSDDPQRKTIDAGRTGDKVPFPDPAAAPLGTDAEAGGAVSQLSAAPTPATPPLHGPAISDESGRRIDGDLTPAGRSRVTRMTVLGLGLIALIGVGLALLGMAAR